MAAACWWPWFQQWLRQPYGTLRLYRKQPSMETTSLSSANNGNLVWCGAITALKKINLLNVLPSLWIHIYIQISMFVFKLCSTEDRGNGSWLKIAASNLMKPRTRLENKLNAVHSLWFHFTKSLSALLFPRKEIKSWWNHKFSWLWTLNFSVTFPLNLFCDYFPSWLAKLFLFMISISGVVKMIVHMNIYSP